VGGPGRRRPRAVSSSGHLLCVRYTGKEPLFDQAGRCAVGLQMGRIDHEFFGSAASSGQLDENPPEYAQRGPADEAVVDCLVRPVAWWPIAPPEPVADHEDDPADHPAVIHTQYPMR
jgi:hypothetical protein